MLTTPWSFSIIHSSSSRTPLIWSTNHRLHIKCRTVETPILTWHFTNVCELSTSIPHGIHVDIHLSLDLCVGLDRITDQTLNQSFFSANSLTVPVSLTLLVTLQVCTLLNYRWNPLTGRQTCLSIACTFSLGRSTSLSLFDSLLVLILIGSHLDDTMSSTFNWFHLRHLHTGCILYLYNYSTLPSSPSD